MTTPSAEERSRIAREWEAKLATEGLASEPAPDKGKKALEELVESQTGVRASEEDLVEALQKYWLTRGEMGYGHHTQVAMDIEQQLGLPPKTVDESLMKTIEDQMGQAQIRLKAIVHEVRQTPTALLKGDLYVKNRSRVLLQQAFPEFSQDVVDILTQAELS